MLTEAMKKGGPITITHKDITRYFTTIPEAARLVITAGAMAKGGEIFVWLMVQCSAAAIEKNDGKASNSSWNKSWRLVVK